MSEIVKERLTDMPLQGRSIEVDNNNLLRTDVDTNWDQTAEELARVPFYILSLEPSFCAQTRNVDTSLVEAMNDATLLQCSIDSQLGAISGLNDNERGKLYSLAND